MQKVLTQTEEWRVQEYMKCKSDLIYFCENYVKLSLAGGDRNVPLYAPQVEFLKTVLEKHHVITCKSRQTGVSTITQMYAAWCCTFYKNVIIGIVSRSGPESTDFCRKTLQILDSLPEWMRPKFHKRTEQQFILKNGSKFYASQVNSANPESLFRGKSITVLIVDEGAFISKVEEAYTGCGPALFKAQTLARDANVPYATIIISTPNRTTGIGKWYFKMWSDSIRKDSIYYPFVLHWKMIKEFVDDPTWYATQCKILGNVAWKIAQELDMEFVASSNSFFQPDTIKELNKVDTEAPFITNINGYDFYQYTVADKEKFYLIGVDTASAYGTDSSTIQVMDYETGEQVGEFQSKLRVDEFCPIVEKICKIYPNSLLIPESNSYGNQLCEYLSRTDGNINIYKTKVKSKDLEKQGNVRFRYGLYTNPQNRPLIVDSLFTFVSEDPNLIKSKRTALELISLIDNGNGKIAAEEGEHDDLSMAYAFCCYVKLRDPPMNVVSKYMTQEHLDNAAQIVNWNDDEAGLVSVSPLLHDMYSGKIRSDESNDFSNIDEHEKINKTMRTFIDTNLDKLLLQRALDNNTGASTIDILKIINGKRPTNWIR